MAMIDVLNEKLIW